MRLYLRRIPLRLFSLLLAAGLFVLAYLPAQAQAQASSSGSGSGSKIAEQACDPAYWKTLKHRAWMEAEREIIQNQNLIFKPDSVLEYVCFDKFVNHTAKNAGPIFSQNKTYFGKEIIPEDAAYGLTKGLEAVVAKSIKAYQDGSFKHQFLANRGPFLETKTEPSLHPLPATTTREDYTCNIMQAVWKSSKCINFIDKSNQSSKSPDKGLDNFFDESGDGFYPFRKLEPVEGNHRPVGYEDHFKKEQDPRRWPYSGECQAPDDSWWKERIDTSRNDPNNTTVYKFGEPLGTVFKDVRKRVEPGECSTAIETGVGDVTYIKDGKEEKIRERLRLYQSGLHL